MKRLLLLLPSLALVFAGCEKEITVDLPEAPDQLVVNGTIEPGRAPIVVLSRTASFFDPTDYGSLIGIFVQGATITIDNGDGPVQLDEVCSDDIPEELRRDAGQLIGIDPAYLPFIELCIYTKLDGSLNGEVGRDYALSVQAEGHTLSATTHLYPPEPIDSIWFKLAAQDPDDDSLGFIWHTTSEPPGLGDGYRWMGQRISHNSEGNLEDPFFIAPYFATFQDKYIDGLTFDWAINRGSQPYSTDEDDMNEESGYFKRNDTVLVKFVHFGSAEYDFYNSFDINVTSQGDIFGNPSNVKSNVTGGLGIWAGWGAWVDTLVCVP